GGECTLDASTSSQFISALLLAGPHAEQATVIRHHGPPLPSLPHIDLTVAMLRRQGVEVDNSVPDTWRIAPGPISGGPIDVEPDLSNAAPFLAAAMVTGGTVHIRRWPMHTIQPGAAVTEILTEMGASFVVDETGLTLSGDAPIHGIDVDLRDVSEL